METFERQTSLPASVADAFAWHERPGALDRLIPPWENVQVEQRPQGIQNGARVVLANRLGPVKFRWLAEHDTYEPPLKFRDIQLSGPFAKWEHTHRFSAEGPIRISTGRQSRLSLARRLAGQVGRS